MRATGWILAALLPLTVSILLNSVRICLAGTAPGAPVWFDDGSTIVGNMSYIHVHNLSELSPITTAVGSPFFLPWIRPPAAKPTTTTTTTNSTMGSENKKRPRRPMKDRKKNGSGSKMVHRSNPDSILGYDIPCGIRNIDESNRIVGGVEAVAGEFPWQISLQKRRWLSLQHVCGGAIVAPYWVVTAGHCVANVEAKDLSVVAGDHDLFAIEGNEQRRNVVRIVGLGYDKQTFANDITLLQLDRRLKFNAKSVAPICVPTPGHHYRDGDGVVSGWGRLSESGGLPQKLQQVTLPLIPWETCKRTYKTRGFSKYLHTCQICSGRDLGGQDSCQGDSGGPLACREGDGRYYLCGVVSWGVGCARAEYPGVYTEVSCYARWINEVLYNEHHYLDPDRNYEKQRP